MSTAVMEPTIKKNQVGKVFAHMEQRKVGTSKINVKDLNLFYGEKQALFGVDLAIRANEVTALIGPSGCGKSTFLRTLNRMNDLIDGVKITGEVVIDQERIYSSSDVIKLRTKVGMVFQKPNLFPMSIYDNVAYGPRGQGITNKKELNKIVEESLRGCSDLGRGKRPS